VIINTVYQQAIFFDFSCPPFGLIIFSAREKNISHKRNSCDASRKLHHSIKMQPFRFDALKNKKNQPLWLFKQNPFKNFEGILLEYTY